MKKLALAVFAAVVLLAAAGCTKEKLANTWCGNGVINTGDWDSFMVWMTLHEDGTVTRFQSWVDDAYKPSKARQVEGIGSWTNSGKKVSVTLDPSWARFSWESLTTEYELDGQCLYLTSGTANTGANNAVNGPDGRVYQWMVSSTAM